MNNFCPQPWVGLDISPQGQIKPCCKYSKSLEDNLDNYFKSEKLQQLKDQFLRNQRPNECKRCWDDEDSGFKSKRQLDLEYALDFDIQNLNHVKILSLPFGNTCNLACRTCSSYASSRWEKDEKKLKNHFSTIEIHKHKKFYQDNDFISNIQKISANVIDITFPGGESFVTGVNEQLDYLDFLIADNPQQITLTYITNCTRFPNDKFWTRWKKFKKINIQLSIDGTGKKFEYIRYPANWDNVYSNVKKYQEKQQQLSNLQLSLSHTVSIFNIYYLNEFLLWCLKEKLPNPYLGMVENPIQYNIRALPKNIKHQLLSKLSIEKLEPVKRYIEVDLDHDFKYTLDWINALDKLRNQKFHDVFPEMSDLYGANKY